MTDKKNVLCENKNLAGISTSIYKKGAVESLIDYFSTVKDFQNKQLLIANHHSLLYALLNHKYFFQTTWAPSTFTEDSNYLSNKINLLINNNNLPDYIVFTPFNSRDDFWPMNKYKIQR